MTSQLRRIYQLVRSFLFGIINKEFLIFCFFLLLSGSFWLSMTLDETYEREFSVPVELKHIPDNVILSTEIESTLTFTISDKGFAMLNYLHGNRLKPVTIDFRTYANKSKGKGNVPQADLQGIISKMLLSSSHIVATLPDHLEFAFSYGTSQTKPVSLIANVTTAKNRYLLESIIDPDSVKVFADKKTLRTMSSIPTEEFDIDELKDSTEVLVALQHAQGVKCIPDTVRVILRTDAIIEQTVEVPLQVINAPTDKTITLMPEKVKINYSVGAAQANKVKADQFRVVVNYNEMAPHPTDPCKMHLQKSPAQVSNVRLEEAKVTFLVGQP